MIEIALVIRATSALLAIDAIQIRPNVRFRDDRRLLARHSRHRSPANASVNSLRNGRG